MHAVHWPSTKLPNPPLNLFFSEHRFDIVAVWIENECGIVAGRMAAGSQAGPAIVDPAREKCCLMKGINLLPASGTKRCMLLNAMGMENIDPEQGVVDAVCHPTQVRAFVFYWPKSSGDTHDDFHAEWA
jgi:hypothetical protein